MVNLVFILYQTFTIHITIQIKSHCSYKI